YLSHRSSAPQPPPRAVPTRRASDLGRAGEDLAAAHLRACGWQIVERNLRLKQGELDIVALAHTTLVFVEVKTRRSFVTGVPQARSEEHTSELQSRFDLVCRLQLEKK